MMKSTGIKENDFVVDGKLSEDFTGCYLVLYPDVGMRRIVPYIFLFYEESSSFYKLEDSYLINDNENEEAYFFAPVSQPGEKVVCKPILHILESNLQERQIYKALEETAENLVNHPYIKQEADRKKMVETLIEESLIRN